MLLLSQHDPSRSACYCCHNMTPVTPHVTSVTTGPQLLPMLRLSHDPSCSPCYCCHMTPAAPHVTAVTTWPQPLPTLLLSQHDPSRSPCYCCHNWTPVALHVTAVTTWPQPLPMLLLSFWIQRSYFGTNFCCTQAALDRTGIIFHKVMLGDPSRNEQCRRLKHPNQHVDRSPCGLLCTI